VLGSLAAAVLVTVGLLVAAGVVYPQFSPPPAPKAAADDAADAADRGRELFLSPSIGCFRCHRIAGQGGIRGPDLTDVAGRAGGRVPELAAGKYLLEKIKAGSAYRYQVPKYAPMMPPFRALAKEKQLADIVAYLLALKPSTAPGGDTNGDGPVGD
jgi:mono/diheme cytochrome c family protein